MSVGLSNKLRFQRNKQSAVGSLYKAPFNPNSKPVRIQDECITSRVTTNRHTSVEPISRHKPTSGLQKYFNQKRNKENIEDSKSVNISEIPSKSARRPILRQVLPSTKCEVIDTIHNSFYNKLNDLESKLHTMEDLKKEVKIPYDFFSPVKIKGIN